MLLRLSWLIAVDGVWLARRVALVSAGSWVRMAESCWGVMTELSARNSSSWRELEGWVERQTGGGLTALMVRKDRLVIAVLNSSYPILAQG